MPRPSAPPTAKPRVVATPRSAPVATPRSAPVTTPVATAAAPRATASAPVVSRAPAKRPAPARHKANKRRAGHRATAAPATAESERMVTIPPRPAAVAHATEESGDGRRVAVAGLTLLGLALTSAGFLVLTVGDQRGSPRT
jgi:hypothetical protein